VAMLIITILCKFSSTKAVFTLGQNMVSLIANETLVMRSVHIRQCIVQIMVETGLFWAWLKQPHDQTKQVRNGGWMQRVAKCPIELKLGQLSCWNMGQWTNTTPIIGSGWKAEYLREDCCN